MAGSGVTQPRTGGASLPVVRALLDAAQRGNYHSGVLGIRTRPEWTGADTFVHDDVPVRVVPCVSALAVREALLERDRGGWLVVLTDRPEDDLGAGLLSHFVWHRLRTPDPWDAVRHRFAATGIDPALSTATAQRDLANGLLAATPPGQWPTGGWPPAPGGVLTRDHALAEVARTHLRLGDPDVDATTVLTWTADPAIVNLVGDLRQLAGDAVTDVVLEWVARRAGAAAAPLLHLLRRGEAGDAVPLGLVVGILAESRESQGGDTAQLAREALIRLEPRMGGTTPSAALMRSWSAQASGVVASLLQDHAGRPGAEQILARADDLLADGHARSLADRSDLLPLGLTARLARLAAAMRTGLGGEVVGVAVDLDASLVRPEALEAVEQAWTEVATHRLADGDRRVVAFRAAVRLVRWLATSASTSTAEPTARGSGGDALRSAEPGAGTLHALINRHRDADAWVDSAINDAAPGVGDPDLGAALAAVLATTRARRDAHDLSFAVALVTHTRDDPAAEGGAHRGVWHLEDLLPRVVLPLASKTPVLFLVLDGMSVGVGTEVLADVLDRADHRWVEALLPGQTRRATALAVLPTLTEVSRASLLSGELRSGGQDAEQRGYAQLSQAHGLPMSTLFHKKPLDSSRLGFAVADDVGAAVDDVTGRPLVSCILNTIDDALDRSDPGGTDWGADTVKHLEPLLARAHIAGRTVVITADHGHVVERRQGTMRPHPVISSGRSRDASRPAGAGEVLVAGRRVLEHDGRAVLAVDERLRYGPLKAGYHGGASPAEAVVPVAVLVPGAVPEGTGLELAPPQEPSWWTTAALPSARDATSYRTVGAGKHLPTLFDEVLEQPTTPIPSGIAARHPAAEAVLISATYAAQRKLAGRVSTTDGQVLALLSSMLSAPSQRLAPAQAAVALAVAPLALKGAILHVQRLLNVEGYAVVRVDGDGSTVVLDEALLREQFEVGG